MNGEKHSRDKGSIATARNAREYWGGWGKKRGRQAPPFSGMFTERKIERLDQQQTTGGGEEKRINGRNA